MHSEEKRTRHIQWSFWFFDFLLLCSGVALVVIALLFEAQDGSDPSKVGPHTLRSLVFSTVDKNGALILGILYLAAVLLSLPAYLSSTRRNFSGAATGILEVFNWFLIIVVCATVAAGLAVWFFTLREKAEFFKVWEAQPPAIQSVIQDSLQCCGFFNATAAGAFTSATGFCAQVTNVTANPCETPFVHFADVTLNDAFTTVFGLTGATVGLFFSGLCLVHDRHEVERFRRIDEKKGARGGFV